MIEVERERDEQQPVIESFRKNTARRLAILAELRELELEAENIHHEAARRWRFTTPHPEHGRQGVAADAGIPAALLNFLEPTFWSWNGMPGAAGGRIDAIRAAVRRWYPDLIVDHGADQSNSEHE